MTHVTFAFDPTEEDSELAAWAAEEFDAGELLVVRPAREPGPARPRLPGLQAALWALGDLAESFAERVLGGRRLPSDLARTVKA